MPGCRTKQPHLASKTTHELHHTFSEPERLTQWVKHCIVELIQSVIDDVNNRGFFAYLTRWRQPEEMYYRALYMLFIADKSAIPHIVSGEPPNSFSATWESVNKMIMEGRGSLDKPQLGLNGEEFTAMSNLNNSAHASFATVVSTIEMARNPAYLPLIEKHLDHWKRLCVYLNHMEAMFKAGRPTSTVLVAVKNLHKPASAWQQEKPTALRGTSG